MSLMNVIENCQFFALPDVMWPRFIDEWAKVWAYFSGVAFPIDDV